MSELTTERLEKRIKNCIEVGNGCVMLPVSVAEELLAYRKTVNHLLDSDGSRGRFSAMELYDARKDLELLLASTAQPVSEPYKLPELNDELIEILGRPNFTCTKLAECLRNCGQHIKRKSEHEQAAVLHVLLNLYIKHGNDWRKHAEEAFTPAVAQESE